MFTEALHKSLNNNHLWKQKFSKPFHDCFFLKVSVENTLENTLRLKTQSVENTLMIASNLKCSILRKMQKMYLLQTLGLAI